MFEKLAKKAVSLLAAIVMASSSVSPVYAEDIVTTEAVTEAATEEVSDLTFQSLEIYPNGEEAEQVVTLDGLMPEGAEATAVDVSDEHDGIAAYDITITDGENDYQPGEENPILVEINDPVITEDITLWHILDDGTREQIFDLYAVEGSVRFYATGFSVYEIVPAEDIPGLEPIPEGEAIRIIDNGGEATLKTYDGVGLYIQNSSTSLWVKAEERTISGNTGLSLVSNREVASKFYFVNTSGMQYKIYCLDDGQKYIKQTGPKIELVESEDEATIFNSTTNADKFRPVPNTSGSTTWKSQKVGNDYLLVGNGNNIEYLWYFEDVVVPNDAFDLDGKTYGLMYHNAANNTTTGYGMVADDSTLSTHELKIRSSTIDPSGTLYVDNNADITMWTFHSTSEDYYTLEADNGKYLVLTSDGVSLTDSAEDATPLKVTPGSDANAHKIQLSANGKIITLSNKSFTAGTSGTWLDLVQKSALTEGDFIPYSATKVGVSDKTTSIDPDTGEPKQEYVVTNGTQIIVYTRVWNESEKRYDFYAMDHLGRLVPCYESGDSIMWMGSQINTLLWDFTDYQYPDGTSTGYYELYNPYSRKNLVPMKDGKILSNEPVGINLRGRVEGYEEYYTRIVSWDDDEYAFFAFDADPSHGKVLSRKDTELEQKDESADFYFAIMEPEPEPDEAAKLHPVETIDNTQYGISMRMVDFSVRSKESNFLGDNSGGADVAPKQGLLSTNLGADGYPTTALASSNLSGYVPGRSLKDLFDNPGGNYGGVAVNHLFIKSTYEASGYFEFDSCQNTATLVPDGTTLARQKDDEGNPLYLDKDGKLTTEASSEGVPNEPMYAFTVYRELATDNKPGNVTHMHGQFFPYNTIVPTDEASLYANHHHISPNNPENLYDALKNPLSPDDPRRGEPLYLLQYSGNDSGSNEPNCYNGTELSAGFVQTPNGHDAWGHDIIFEFTGDDDFWLYVDDELIIDLGGIHSALYGSVNFATGKVTVDNNVNNKIVRQTKTLREIFEANYRARGMSESEIATELSKYFNDGEDIFKDYSTHTMRIFYLERGAGASNLHMRFNLSYITPGSVLMSKDVSGAGEIDYSLLKYPYQIWYQEDKGDGNGVQWYRLTPTTENFGVYYLNPKREANYYPRYRSPSNNEIYEDVYFLTPGKDVSISFPADTIQYYIMECGLNGEVYETVECNGDPDNTQGTDIYGGKNFKIVEASVHDRPNVQLTNKVDPNAVKTLTIKKKLVGRNGIIINDDQTTFNFRLFLEQTVAKTIDTTDEHGNPSQETVETRELKAAYIHKYYVVSRNGFLCKWESGSFVEDPSAPFSNLNNLSYEEKAPYTFQTSPNGQISKIPVGYEVKVPDLINGMRFRVEEREEDNPIGYDVYELEGYTCVNDDDTSQPSYQVEDGNNINTGTVIKASSPSMLITNKRGFGIEVTKKWSDADYTDMHDTIYIAVYVNGVLKEGSVREITNDKLTQRYFFDDEALYDETLSLNDYQVREVTAVKTVDPVTGNPIYSNIQPVDPDTSTQINAVPTGGTSTEYTYNVHYDQGKLEGVINNARRDTVTNIREGGVAIRLFDWDDPTKTHPLAGGTFKLRHREQTGTDDNGDPIYKVKDIDTYTSSSNGIVAILYGDIGTGTFILEQVGAPNGYIGMSKPIEFTVGSGEDGVVTIVTDENDTGWADHDTTDETHTYKGFVDIHNKPFTLRAIKTDSSTGASLPGAEFALYRGIVSSAGYIIQDYYPLDLYVCDHCGEVPDDPTKPPKKCKNCNDPFDDDDVIKQLRSGADGVIPLITQKLPPDTYFLTEKKPPANYTGIQHSILFRIDELGNITIGSDVRMPNGADSNGNPKYASLKPELQAAYSSQSSYLARTGGTFTISVPNTSGAHDYYFNIRKLTFLDKYIHGDSSDSEQKFVFKVERFLVDDTDMHSVQNTFYVTLNCETAETGYPGSLSEFIGHEYDAETHMMTVTCADGEDYSFPTSIYSGEQTVKVTQTGIYKVTEVTEWSNTDYDFWTGSSIYTDNTKLVKHGTAAMDGNAPFVAFRITETDTDKANAAAASFTNTETEYAYLSSQAYAENTIKRN